MRRAHKVDTTQSAIVDALRKVGVRVVDTSMVGDDYPDLTCGWRGRNILLECKTVGKKRTKGQQDFADTWPGELYLVYSVDDAFAGVFEGRQA